MDMLYLIGGSLFFLIIIGSSYMLVQMIQQGKCFKTDKKLKELQLQRMSADPAYTMQMLDAIHDLTNRVSLIEFNKMIDGKDISKLHMNALKPVIDSTANRVHEAIKEKLKNGCGILNEDFINDYIIDVTTMSIKSLMEKRVDEVIASDF